VNQAAPPAGSSAAATDTIEVVAGAVKRVGAVASVPVTSFTPKVDAMDAYMVFGGKKHPLESVEGASVNTRSGDQFENDSRMKNIIIQSFTFGVGSKSTVGIDVTKRWSKSDNTLWIGTRALKSQAAFSISYLKNNVQYLKYDMTNAILGSVVVTYPAPGATTWPTEHLRFISRLVDLKQTTS
jgi:hypothetical protein